MHGENLKLNCLFDV